MSLPEANAPAPAGPQLPAPWGVHAIEEGKTAAIEVGPLSIWLRHRNDEIWVAHAGREDGAPPLPEPPDEEPWARWAVHHAEPAVRLVPIFPDRPLVVEPELTFRLLRHAEARVYVRVPLWVRVELASAATLLLEVPTVRMSDTWFGGFGDGELCYWHATTARREVHADLFQPHLVLCPLQLSNLSEGELQVQKIALRVPHLTLFATAEGGFWADETRVRYEGDELGSRVDISGRPPAEAPSAHAVTKPRVPVQHGFRTRTFQRLKALSGFGHGF